MCIRDREGRAYNYLGTIARLRGNYQNSLEYYQKSLTLFEACLLYTSDAADERSSVDLGGRRIIKKKKNIEIET